MKNDHPKQDSPDYGGPTQQGGQSQRQSAQDEYSRVFTELMSRAGAYRSQPEPTEEFRRVVLDYRNTRIELANPGAGDTIGKDRLWILPPLNETVIPRLGDPCHRHYQDRS
jgi:hypothetical protein